MKNVLRVVLTILEYVALFIVGYYGIKYTFVAGPIYFGSVWGAIVPVIIVALAAQHIIRKERGDGEL